MISKPTYEIVTQTEFKKVPTVNNSDVLTKANARWYSKAIGELCIFDSIDVPPTNLSDCRYIRLTANDAYNSGILTSQAVTGTAPLITATAKIVLANSPFNNKTINLINTEGRAIVAGVTADALRDDAIQNITGGTVGESLAGWGTGTGTGAIIERTGGNATIQGGSGNAVSKGFGFNAALVVRTDNSTHPRDISKVFYMRVL